MSTIQTRPRVEQFIRNFISAMQMRTIYGKEHRLAREAVTKVMAVLAEIFSECHEITLGIIGDEIAFEKEPFYDLSKSIKSFITYLREFEIEKMTVVAGVTEKEFTELLDLLSKNAKTVEAEGGLRIMASSGGITHIRFSKIGFETSAESPVGPAGYQSAAESFKDGFAFLEGAFDDIKNNKMIDARAARFFIGKVISNLFKNKNSLLMLTSIKTHDEYTFIHSINVAIFALVQAEALGLDEGTLTEIGIAALMHDIGKLSLPHDLLQKKEALNEDDIGEIRMHPAYGAKILLQNTDITPVAAIVAFQHHIKHSAKGYPACPYGQGVSLPAMIISIADVYDALRSKRAYHEDMAPEKTYSEMMKMAGDHFRPGLVENFFRLVGVYPPGTLVELDDKSVGIVVRGSPIDMMRPQVEILYGAEGAKVHEPYMVNLIEKVRDTDEYKHSIVKSLAPSEKYPIPDKYKG